MGILLIVALLAIAAMNAAWWWLVDRSRVALIDDLTERVTYMRPLLTTARREARTAERERDAYSDALASIVDVADWSDLEAVRAHANQALAGGDYHGRLRAAQEALEAEVDRNEDLDRQVSILAENLVGEQP